MNGFMVLITRFHIKRARLSRSLTVYYISYTLGSNHKASENQGSDNMSFFMVLNILRFRDIVIKTEAGTKTNVPALTNYLP